MFFAKTLIGAALAVVAAAQSSSLTFTNVPNPITAGEAQAILYATDDSQSPVTILLRRGPSGNLQTVETLTSSSVGGQYIWTPSESLQNGNDYALEIQQGGENNYYGPFVLQGASSSAAPSSYASASASLSSVIASASSSAISSIVSSIVSNATMTANSTMTATGIYSSGTGATMSRNATMSSATLTSTRGSQTTSDSTATGGAGFEGTDSASNPEQTGNAAASNTGKSTLAFVVGALAAVLYVQ